MTYGEMTRIFSAEQIEKAWNSKKSAEKPTFWAVENPTLSRVLAAAKEAANSGNH